VIAANVFSSDQRVNRGVREFPLPSDWVPEQDAVVARRRSAGQLNPVQQEGPLEAQGQEDSRRTLFHDDRPACARFALNGDLEYIQGHDSTDRGA
jgi:hypothetical protein